MASALTDIYAIKLLLNGGHICQIVKPCRNKRDYKIHVRDDTAPSGWSCAGHITARQFEKFATNGLIEMVGGYDPSRADKYGNTFHYYRLAYRGVGDSSG